MARNTKLTDNLTLSERKDGYWLYDHTRGMHLSMRAKTQEDAFIEGITFYQKSCAEIEHKNKKLYDNVNSFIESLSDNDEIYMFCNCEEC